MEAEIRESKVADLIQDGILVINDGYRAKNSELADHGLPFARAGNINNGFHFNDADRVPLDSLSKVGAKISAPGDVVFTSKGTVGRFALVGEDTDQFVYSPQLCYWRSCDHDVINPKWLYYWMNGRDFFEQFKGVAGQTDMAEYVSLRDQRAMKISYPPPSEQKRVAHILGTLDDKIELNRRMNATLEAMARALFQSWFVDFDPVRRNAEGATPRSEDSLFPDSFEDSTMGEIPKGWKLIPLYETATYRNGAPFKASDFCPAGEGMPVVKIAELKSGLTDGTKWSPKVLEPDQMIDTGDLLYSWSGSPDTSLDAFLWSNGPGLVNQHIFKVITSNDAEKRFVYYLLKHLRPILVETARDKQTTGLGHVTVADMKRLQVCRPPKNVLTAFDKLIAPIFDKAFTNTVESQTLATLRDTLLPKLLSGEFSPNRRS